MRRGALIAVGALAAVVVAAWWLAARESGPPLPGVQAERSRTDAAPAFSRADAVARPAALPERPAAKPQPESTGAIEALVTAGGRPVAGAQVAVHLRAAFDASGGRYDWKTVGRETTGADGRARIAVPGSGVHLIGVRATGYGRAWKELSRPQGELVTRVDIPLFAAVALTGRVLVGGGNEPVPLAEVSVSASNQSRGRKAFPPDEVQVVHADAHGAFRVDGLSPGSVEVMATAVGHAAASKPRVSVPGEVTLRLHAASYLSGQILDAEGKPAAGAQVVAIGPSQTVNGVASSGGGYSLEVEAGLHRITASLDGQAAAAPSPVAVAAGQTRQLAPLRLAPGASLVGTVRSARDQRPIGGANLALSPRGVSGDLGRATSDEAGAFTFAGLAPGPYDLEVKAAGHAPLHRHGLFLLAGQKVAIDAPLGAAATVEGVVRDRGGRSVAGILVSIGREADAESTHTAADGSYRLTGVTPGAGVLIAQRDGAMGASKQAVEVPAGGTLQQDLIVTDAEEGTVEGTIALPSGAPAPAGTAIRVFQEGSGLAAPALSDPGGRFSLRVAAGTVRIWATAESEGSRLIAVGRAEVAAGEVARLDLKLAAQPDDEGKKISGIVLEPDGTPSAGASVRAERGPAERASFAQSGPDGTFTILAGADRYTASNGSRSGGAAPSGETVTIRLGASASVRGRVLGGDRPVARFRVQVYPFGGRYNDAAALSFEGDRFELADLSARKSTVRVTTDDARLGEAQLELAEGVTAEVDVTLQAALSVTGRVLEPDGLTPAVRSQVRAGQKDGTWRNTFTKADGRFTLAEIAGGSYTLTVSSESGFLTRSLAISTAPIELGDLVLKVRPGAVGLNLAAKQGKVAIKSVVNGGPASVAGVLVGDLLLDIDGRPVASLSDAILRLRGAPGAPVSLGLQRDGIAVPLSISRQPAEAPPP